MFEQNNIFYSMLLLIIFLSYMLYKSIKSKKRLHNRYEEVYKGSVPAEGEMTP